MHVLANQLGMTHRCLDVEAISDNVGAKVMIRTFTILTPRLRFLKQRALTTRALGDQAVNMSAPTYFKADDVLMFQV